MNTIDVAGPIQRHLDRANRKFDAAMDALVPPSPDELLQRNAPGAVAFGEAFGILSRSFNTLVDAIALGYRLGQETP